MSAKKQIQEKNENILKEIKREEDELQKEPTASAILYQIKFLHQQLSMLTVTERETKLYYVKHNKTEFVNKPGKWQALKIKEGNTVLRDNVSI